MEQQLKDRDRVIAFKAVEVGGETSFTPAEEARGILISVKDDKAYILPDGMKTIKVWPLAAVQKEPEEKVASASALILGMLTFLRGYYSARKPEEGFRPGQNTKIECIDYLIKQEREGE
jgi:hypothetical protein